MYITSRSGRKITIRPPQKTDVEQLLQFINELVAEDAPIFVNQKFTKKKEEKFVNQGLKSIRKKEAVQLLGFYKRQLIANCQINKAKYRMDHVGTFGISVNQGFRGEGIGLTLSKLVINQAKKILKLKIITLEVIAGNEKALNLYKKLGFKKHGSLPEGIKYEEKLVSRIYMYKKI